MSDGCKYYVPLTCVLKIFNNISSFEMNCIAPSDKKYIYSCSLLLKFTKFRSFCIFFKKNYFLQNFDFFEIFLQLLTIELEYLQNVNFNVQECVEKSKIYILKFLNFECHKSICTSGTKSAKINIYRYLDFLQILLQMCEKQIVF